MVEPAHLSNWTISPGIGGKFPTYVEKKTFPVFHVDILVGGWTNPSEKYARQNGFIFSNFRDEHKKYLSCHHLGDVIPCCEWHLPSADVICNWYYGDTETVYELFYPSIFFACLHPRTSVLTISNFHYFFLNDPKVFGWDLILWVHGFHLEKTKGWLGDIQIQGIKKLI